MSTKTIIAWVDGDAQEIEVEEMDYIDLEPSIEERLTAIEQTHSPKFINSVTLYANSWVGDASPYTQVVEIDGVTPYSMINLQPSTEQLSIFYEKDLAFVAENEDGVITVSCIGHKPLNDYTIQITLTEVIVNE
jgi:hypothetical protein